MLYGFDVWTFGFIRLKSLRVHGVLSNTEIRESKSRRRIRESRTVYQSSYLDPFP